MTTTSDTTSDITSTPTGFESAGGPAGTQIGELMLVDPRDLIIGPNVRRDTALDKEFLRDIAERGVREPIPVRRNCDNQLVVIKGQRRTVAAIEANLASVRVFIEPDDQLDDQDTHARIERIIDQLGENHHRIAVSTSDKVAAHQQLLDLGLKAGQIGL